MRSYIGNITSNKDRQVNPNPDHEQWRLDLIRTFRIERAEAESRMHFQDISGQREATEAILLLFDEKGNPPANIGIESLIGQYHALSAQRKWIDAVFHELLYKLGQIDPGRYRREQEERASREQDREAEKEQVYLRYMEGKPQNSYPKLREVIRMVLQKDRRARELNQYVKKDTVGRRIIGVRQIESALCCLFANHDHADGQYETIQKETGWLEKTIAEIETKMSSVQELIESSRAYLNNRH